MPHRTKRVFKAGDRIFNEGEKQDIAFIVEEGQVEIFTDFKGERRTLNVLGAGALFGELALVDRQPRSASAEAKTDTLLTIVTQQQVEERLADADPILRMVLFVVMRHFRSEVDRSRDGYGPYARATETRDDFNERKVAEAIEMIKLEAELRSAMRNDEFRLHYQPIHDLRSQKIAGLEALIRWKSPTRGDIMPAAFMPLAEATSLVVPIGNWVIDAGLKDYLHFREAAGDHLTLSFNLARRQMESTEFLPFLSDSVSSRGFGILLDDFGTGYSSLQYLQEYQPAALKIDRSFVKGLGVRQESERICKAVIELAQALGIGVIAEGVETLQQARMLQNLGCHHAQGYFFSPPLSADAIRQRLGA